MSPDQLRDLSLGLATRPRADLPSALVGFDAFLDDLTEVVEIRQSPESYQAMPTIGRFAAWAAASSGRSGLREAVVTRTCAGGCAINLGDGLAALGFGVDACIGLGATPHPAFAPVLGRFRSVLPFPAEPGRTTAYEFSDGKLMLCSTSHLAAVTPALLTHSLDWRAYRQLAAQAEAIVLTSWSVYSRMTDCWRWLSSQVLQDLPNRPRFFVDLADPAGRSLAEIREMAAVLREFEALGPVTLSLNVNEATRLSEAFHLPAPSLDLAECAATLRVCLEIDEVSIHAIREAATATRETCTGITGPFCPRPRQSVGAGDRFNAGLLAGHLLRLSTAGRLATATAASGFFVRQARSATLPELADFLAAWAAGSLH